MADLLTRQGPLAHVWLASNYDKKLSKQQLLKTNLIRSSEYIANQPIQSSSRDTNQPITLRLSGHLLLGIVRIYSRKTKYLLDDVNEVLYKLKNSFKFASGATLGTSAATVNLPPQQTTLSNINRIMLQDQVTDLNLLYQEDLDLDDHPTELLNQVGRVGALSDEMDLDRSIEVGRGAEAAVDENQDFDLDFDLSMDMDTSIEQGRDAQVAMPDADQSLLDIGSKGAPEQPLDFDLGEPLETITELQTALESGPTENRQRRRLVGVGNDGVVRTTKRKIIADSAEDLERGLPTEVLRSIQHLQTFGGFAEEHLTINLSPAQKLQLIKELAGPSVAKRRKIWNLDEELTQRADELSAEEQRQKTQQNQEYDLDFDLSLPSLESDSEESRVRDDILEDGGLSNVKTTTQVAQHLRNAFLDEPTVPFDSIVNKDLEFKNPEEAPLGMVNKTDTSIEISKRREATKCFFETLVLATENCITLHQTQAEPTDIGGDITIRPLDNLAAKFL